MLPAAIEQALSLIEQQCAAVAAAVASGEPQALETASQALRQTAVDFAALLQQLGGGQEIAPELQARLKPLAAQLHSQRENLLRRAALVEQAVQTLLPSTRQPTYSPGGRAGAYKAFAT